jgi:RHS repeat-associated protein
VGSDDKGDGSYYPYGLTMAGISDKAVKWGYAENKYRFNKGSELQNKEFSDGSGLEMYETHLRELDPQLGRWWQADPKTDQSYESVSPYSGMNNDPIRYNDPNGDEGETCCKELLDAVKSFALVTVGGSEAIAQRALTGKGTDFAIDAVNSAGSAMNGMVYSTSLSTYTTNPAQDIFGVNTNINQPAASMGQSVGLPLLGLEGPNLPNANSAAVPVSDGLAISNNSFVPTLVPLLTLNANGAPPLKDQAEDVKDTYNGGKNSVTIRTPDKQIRFDLAGGDHNGVPTPHFQVYFKNFDKQGVLRSITNRKVSDAYPMTQQDLRNVIRYFKNRIKNP